MLTNINLKNFNIKTATLDSKHTQAPSFRALLPADTFKKAPEEPLTELEQEVLDNLNAKRAPNDKIKLSKKTLQETVDTFILRKKELPFSYRLQGRKSFIISTRKFLLENVKGKTSFQLAVLQDAIKQSTDEIVENLGASMFIKNPGTPEFYSDFKKFIGIVQINDGQDEVNKLLYPVIRTECYNRQGYKLENIARIYYRRKFSEPKVFTVETEQTPNGEYKSIAYVDGEPIKDATNKSKVYSKSLVMQAVLDDIELLTSKEYRKEDKIPFTYRYNSAARDQVTSMLRDMRFLSQDESLDMYKDQKLIMGLSVVRAPSQNSKNAHIFQRLEFMGDAIANDLVGRFVREKELNDYLTDKVYGDIISNDTFRRYAIAMKLPFHQQCGNREFLLERAPDMFEAVIAVLYKHYPEERIYKYLKPLFEARYKELMNIPNYADEP